VTGLAFSGSGVLAGTESPRSYFRRHLAEHALRCSDLHWYFEQSVPHFSENDEVRLAVEELVDRLGQLVGFEVARAEEAQHAVWTSSSGHQLLVWVVDRSTAVAAIGHAARIRDARLISEHVTPWTDVSCLLVICGPVSQRGLSEALVLRRAGDHQRLASVDALRELAAMHERGAAAHDTVLAVLTPASAFADPLVSLLGRQAPCEGS
jgi:hypothetical protein